MRLAAVATGFALGGFSIANAASYTWDGEFGNAAWQDGDNWVGNSVPTFDNTADLTFWLATVSADTAINEDRTIRSLTFNDNIDADTILYTANAANDATGFALTFEAASGNAGITVDAGSTASLIRIGGGRGTIVLNSTLDVAHNGTGQLALWRGISGAGGIVKSGSGELRLVQGGANTFAGGVTVNGGTLLASGGTTLFQGLGSGTITLGGGTLREEKNFASTGNSSTLSIVTTAATSSTLVYNDLNSATRNTTLGGTATLAGNLHVNNISSAGGADVVVWNKTTTGDGTLSYSGTNDDVLNNTNDNRFQVSGDLSGLTGGIEIRKGTWLASGANALGGGAVNIGVTASADSAAINLNSNSATTIANDITVRSGAGTRLIQNSDTASHNFSGAITLDGTLTYRSDNNDDFTGTSSLSGSGGLVKLGTGQLDLRGSNNGYSGNITVSEGELRTVNAGLGSGDVSIASGANLSLQRTSGSILYSNNISGDGTMLVGGGNLIALGGANTSTGDITVGGSGTTLRIDNTAFNNSTANILTSASTSLLRLNANAADQAIANNISGDGFVIKQGDLRTTLTGLNSYAGTTTINEGTLQVGLAGVGTTGTGDITVNGANAVLAGSGTIQGATSVVLGSIIPGDNGGADNGLLSFASSLSLTPTDTQLQLQIDGLSRGTTYDALNVGSALTYGGDLSLIFGTTFNELDAWNLFDFALASNSFDSIAFSGSYTGSLSNQMDGTWAATISGLDFLFTENTGVLSISGVPEPSRLILLGIAGISLLFRRRRR